MRKAEWRGVFEGKLGGWIEGRGESEGWYIEAENGARVLEREC